MSELVWNNFNWNDFFLDGIFYILLVINSNKNFVISHSNKIFVNTQNLEDGSVKETEPENGPMV